MTPLELYKQFFPDASPSCFQMDLIGSVTDAGVWKQTLEYWAGNGYRAQSVQRMIACYQERGFERAKSTKQRPRDPGWCCQECGKLSCAGCQTEAIAA